MFLCSSIERELRSLEESYKMFLEGHSRGVLIYGFRKVGKSTLVRHFLKDKKGVVIDLSTVRSINVLAGVMHEKLSTLCKVGPLEISEDPIESLRRIFLLPKRVSEALNDKIIVALDEFHVPIENLSTKIARTSKEKKENVMSDILWMLRWVIYESENVFWILISSIGWKKLQDYVSKRFGGPLTGVLDVLKVEPLDLEHPYELARLLTKNEEISEEIARVSGGIPRIIEILARRFNTTGERITKLVLGAIMDGEFDEIFDNMLRLVAEVSRRDYDVLVHALKCVAEGNKTPEFVAKCLQTTREAAYNYLEELHRLGILDKTKERKLVRYELNYPILCEWLKLRVEPTRGVESIIASALGITAESYFRELLGEYEGKEVAIWDDEGSFLAGTRKEFRVKVRKVLSRRETVEILKGLRTADVIVEIDESEILLVKVKARRKPLSVADVIDVDKIKAELEDKLRKKVIAAIALLVDAEIPPATIAEAVRRNIVIITEQGVKLLAKKAGFPYW